jgi:hypothetical protein
MWNLNNVSCCEIICCLPIEACRIRCSGCCGSCCSGCVTKVKSCIDSDFFHRNRSRAKRLASAARDGRFCEVARLECCHTVDHNYRLMDGKTAITYASMSGKTTRVRTAIDHGAEVDSYDHEQRTPLMYATREGHVDTSEELIDHGAGLYSRDKDGKTPFIYAAISGKTDALELYLKHKVDIESRDNYGRTALIHAAENGHNEALKLLLKNGANPRASSRVAGSETATAAVVTRMNGTGLKLLLEHGVNLHAFPEGDKKSAETYRKCLASKELQTAIQEYRTEVNKTILASTPLFEVIPPVITDFLYPEPFPSPDQATMKLAMKEQSESDQKQSTEKLTSIVVLREGDLYPDAPDTAAMY